MPSQNKLIKQGIKYTDSLFKEISNRLSAGILTSDTLESFIANTKDYTVDNPLLTTGYQEEMLKIILQETNNHKFSRPAQKELTRITIENKVGELITDVGEDIKQSVREIVKDGYNQGLSQQEIADNISNKISVIKNKRARAIARTEIARTATISDYIINKEMGATHFHVECRNTACPVCKEAWHKNWSIEKDDNFTPSDSSAGGKGWIGDKVYSMNDASMLPPIHPNCRCVAYFYKKETPKEEDEQLEGLFNSNSTSNGDNINKKYSYQSAEDEYNELLNDPSVNCSKGHKLNSYTTIYDSDETFYKYEFDNITIYKSESLSGVPVKEINRYYEAIEYENIKNSCTEIVLSDKVIHVDNKPMGGYVSRLKDDRIYLLNYDDGLSLNLAIYNMYHEIGHCFNKRQRYSRDFKFRKSHQKDYNDLSSYSRFYTETQKNVSGYVLGLIERLGKTRNKLSDKEIEHLTNRIYSEIFAESIREILLKSNFIENVHINKYEYLQNYM